MKDEIGNRIIQKHDVIYLQLVNESFPRKLGEFISDNIFKMYREYNSDLHINTNSFGFNLKLLNSKVFDYIELHTDKKEIFKIKVDNILKDGKILFYKQQGFEKQIFYPLNLIKQ